MKDVAARALKNGLVKMPGPETALKSKAKVKRKPTGHHPGGATPNDGVGSKALPPSTSTPEEKGRSVDGFSSLALRKALYGQAAHLAEVCLAIVALNQPTRSQEEVTRDKSALERLNNQLRASTGVYVAPPIDPALLERLKDELRASTERSPQEYLGEWLAKATAKELRTLASWRDRPDWPDAVDKKSLGIVLATNQKAIEEAVVDGGLQVIPSSKQPKNESATPRILFNVRYTGAANVAPPSNEKILKAFDSKNRQAVLSRTPDAQLQAVLEENQMGKYEKVTIRKTRQRKFGATRGQPGRPKKPK